MSTFLSWLEAHAKQRIQNKRLRSFLGKIRGQLRKLPAPKRDIFRHYGDTLGLGRASNALARGTGVDTPPYDVVWLIPDFAANSGGHINILRMAQLLQSRGFPRQCIAIMEPHRWTKIEDARVALRSDFGIHNIDVHLSAEDIPPARFLFASTWQSAYWVRDAQGIDHRCYFVQDYEPWFYAAGSESYLAEATYRFGLIGVTAGSWLARHLGAEFGMQAYGYSFSYDRQLYHNQGRVPGTTKRVFFYARPVTPRRCFDLGLLALDEVCRVVPNVEVIFAGWDVGDHYIPFPHLNAGQVPVTELAKLYSSCDVALVLSATNLSLLPMEIAACGCPVVINDGLHASWLFSEEEVLYTSMEPGAIAHAVASVLTEPDVADRLRNNGLAAAERSDWEREADGVAAFLSELRPKSARSADDSPQSTFSKAVIEEPIVGKPQTNP